jgi:hypothetical protein
MTERQLALNDALRALERTETLTCCALAQQCHVTKLDVQIPMLTAQANRLVYRIADGEWAITNDAAALLHQSDRAPRSRARPE